MHKTYIYGLVSNRNTDVIKYVGKADNPENRLKRHIHNTKYVLNKNKKLTHKDYWIIKENYEISFVILEYCEYECWQTREKYYLSIYENLTNTSLGGEGGSGVKYTLSYEFIKDWIKQNLKIKSKTEWYENIKTLPDFVPKNPRQCYLKKGWISWGDFLGTDRVWDNLVTYLSYEESKTIISKLNITTEKEYKILAKCGKIPTDIPNRPNRYYKNRGWVSWGDFLGTGRIANQLKKKVR